MIKRRRMNENGGDLADVNEQELAKDSAEKRFLSDNKETGTDTANGVSAPVCDEKNREDTEKEASAEDAVCDGEGNTVQTEPCEKLPLPVDACEASVELVFDKRNDEERTQGEDREKEQNKSQKEKNTSMHAPSKRDKKGRGYVAIICVCFIASIFLLIFTVASNRESGNIEQTTESERDVGTDTVTSLEEQRELFSAVEIYDRCAATSVTVAASGKDGTKYYSGFSIFADGYVATLYEAISDCEAISIILSDGTSWQARTVGGDATVNLALLKAELPTLESIVVGNSEELCVGNEVFAIGCIGDGKYVSSLATCEVAFENRTPELMGFDGAKRRINALQLGGISDEGMKGAPVFNEYGEAVAVVLATEGNGTPCLAMPIEGVYAVLDAIRLGQEPSEEVLCSLAYIPPSLGIYGEQAQEGDLWGVAVRDFTDENSDAALKLKVGDVIFKVNDELTPDTGTLAAQIEKYRPNDEVEIYVLRNGQKLSFYVKLTKN